MLPEILPAYPVDPFSSFPPRSRLYALPPIGVGTPEVESLTSYLARLAHAHGVTVQKLALAEVLPRLGLAVTSDQRWFMNHHRTLNGMGEWPARLIAALERLTLRSDLAFLTMEPWRPVLAPVPLLRSTLAWCPRCYAQWQQAGQTLYQPLLWSLKGVQMCPQHQHPLQHTCPYPDCRSSRRPLNRLVPPGYCPTCQRWLGLEAVSADETNWTSDQWQWQLWLTEQLGCLFSAAPGLASQLDPAAVALNLKRAVQLTATSSVSRLAGKVGLSRHTLLNWLERRTRPGLDRLAWLSYQLKVPLLDLLTPSPELDHAPLPSPASTAAPKIEPGRLHRQLEQLLADPDYDFVSLAQVAQSLGVSPGIIAHHCPQLHAQIGQRNRQVRQAKRQSRQEKLAGDLTAILAAAETPPPPLTEVARRLQIHPDSVQKLCPDLCRLIIERHRRFYQTCQERMETELRHFLADETQPPLSVSQIARRLATNTAHLHHYFPELCQALTRRYRSYQTQPSPPASPQPALSQHFAALMTLTPPLPLTEVARRLNCNVTFLRNHYPDLCRQLRQQQQAYSQTRNAALIQHVEQGLADDHAPPLSPAQFAYRLGVSLSVLRKALPPSLYAEIVQCQQAHQQAQWHRQEAFLNRLIAENPTPPPSWPQVADSLGCHPKSLQRRFPQASQIIREHYDTAHQTRLATLRTALEAALLTDQQPPLLPWQIAQQLAEPVAYLRKHFPDLCALLRLRHTRYHQQTVQTYLEAMLTEPAHPLLTLEAVSQRLGYDRRTLCRLCPDLCQLLQDRLAQAEAHKKQTLQHALEAILTGTRTPPVPLKTVAEEVGYTDITVRLCFPELATAVSAQYKRYLKEKGQHELHYLCQQVQRLTHELYQVGIDPTPYQVSLHLACPKKMINPLLRQIVRETRTELGLSP